MNHILKIFLATILVIVSFKLFIGVTQTVEEQVNGCISFTVGQGTGCDWMCNYCATNLGTSNYYFTDGVCKYQVTPKGWTGGCVGNPIAGKVYTCCTAGTSNYYYHDEL